LIFSYWAPLSTWIVVLTLIAFVLPFAWLLKNPFPDSQSEEVLPSVSSWLWLVLGLAACFLRFYRLTTLSTWPLSDEGVHAALALDLFKTGKFHFFYTVAQFPPFFIWFLAAFFKVFPPSLFALWFFPALLSCATVGFAFLAARRFTSLPPSFTVIFTLLTAFSFWPLYTGRFCHPAALMLMWEYMALWRLACFVESPEKQRLLRAFLLGVTVGGGFYTFTSWASVALVLSFPVVLSALRKKNGSAWVLPLYFSSLFICLLPLVHGAFQEGFGAYLDRVFLASGPPISIPERLQMALDYVLAPFRGLSSVFFYGPVWGGFLNPILGSLFLLGLCRAFRRRQNGDVWLLVSLPILWLPGILTQGQEMFRIVQLCPFLLAGAAWGFLSLRPLLPKVRGVGMGCALLLLSMFLDGYHLFVAYPDLTTLSGDKKEWRPVEFAQAYQMLERQNSTQGPLLIFDNFLMKPTLAFSVAVEGLNAGEKGDPFAAPPRFAALLANANDQPFLEKRFPQARWQWLPSLAASRDSGLLLGLIPVDSTNLETMKRWFGADRALQAERDRSLYEKIDEDPSGSAQRLGASYGLFKGNPFLESVFWEKTALDDASARQLPKTVEDLRMALKRGYPSANLYYSLGMFLGFEGDKRAAALAFQQALGAPSNRTPAALRLQELGSKNGEN
jgi:hypothetical protein